jgi:hypothetical protein
MLAHLGSLPVFTTGNYTMKALRPLILIASLAAAPSAQGLVGLSVSAPVPSTAFSPASLGNGILVVSQVSMVPHPNGTPGLYLGGMTVVGLSPALGGVGGFDVVSFTYSRTTNVVTLNANAKSLNTASFESGLHWAPSGLYAVANCNAGPCQATTATPAGVLNAPTIVNGVVGLDAVPRRLNGNDVLFYSRSPDIAWRIHDVANSQSGGAANVCASPSVAGRTLGSAWPLVGADGNVQGMMAVETDPVAVAADWNWSGDLDPATPHVVGQVSPGFIEFSGCEAGGRIYMPRLQNFQYETVEYDVIGMLGDYVPVTGGRADLTAFAPIKAAAAPPDLTVIVNGFGFIAPLPVLGINNLLGVNPNIITVLDVILHDNATGRGSVNFSMPTLPAGTVFTLQSLTLMDLGAGPVHLSNTYGIRYQ